MKAKISLMGMLCLVRKLLNKPKSLVTAILFIYICALCITVNAQKPVQNNIILSGTVVSASNGQPLQGATLKITNTNSSSQTNKQGEFSISTNLKEGKIIVSFLGYITQVIPFKSNHPNITIHLESDENILSAVDVIVSTGYQQIPKERATGSFDFIDVKTLNRSVSTDVLGRLKGVANGLLFDKKAGNPMGISVRGRSTIFSNTQPLIVIDNFPYEGELDLINPQDIESITILKDGPASSIWGTRAGNGVIVITTKRGANNKAPMVNFVSNLTVTARPDLNYKPHLSSTEFIEVEQFLFKKGKHNYILSNDYDEISPVLQALNDHKNNLISSDDLDAIIVRLKSINVMDDYSKHFYQNGVNQQYQLNVSGGGNAHTYYLSAGYDKNISDQKGASYNRYTLKGNNSFSLLNNRLKLTSDITFARSDNRNDFYQGYTPLYPYESLIDEAGNSLPVLRQNHLRSNYTDTAGQGKLMDWKYRPLEELRNGYSSSLGQINSYMINLQGSYKIIPELSVALYYQYNKKVSSGSSYNSPESFYTRDFINRITQIDNNSGLVKRPLEIGGIKSNTYGFYDANNARIQFDYDKQIGKHEINAIAGYEARKEDNSLVSPSDLYGYDPANETFQNVNPQEVFPYYYGYLMSTLPQRNYRGYNKDRNLSYYINVGYTYNDRYIISTSFRKDESNLFGVKANQRGVPLWSTGLSWNLHKEEFYTFQNLSYLKLRATLGYSGNINKNTTSLLTAKTSGTNIFYNLYYDIVNPPNPSLRWEKVKNFNLGIDFIVGKNSRLNGSFDYYIKNGQDLMANSPIAPQTGLAVFYGNAANTSAKGIDLKLTLKNIQTNHFYWNTTFIANYNKDKVTKYMLSPGVNSDIAPASGNSIVPFEGYPINTLISYTYAGLDKFGDPLGYFDGEISKDYRSIQQSTDLNIMTFHGSQTPTTYGSLMNIFSYRQLELSFNLLYKFGNYFRRSSFMSNQLVGANAWKLADYDKRWKQEGDELHTYVPAFLYPAVINRDLFYESSSVLIEKGDHIRLQDIRISYQLDKQSYFKNGNIYLYAQNLGVLWKANKAGIDPETPVNYPTPLSVALGFQLNF